MQQLQFSGMRCFITGIGEEGNTEGNVVLCVLSQFLSLVMQS